MDIEIISYGVLIIIHAIATITDVKNMIIPNKLVIVGAVFSIIFMFLSKDTTILSKILGGIISGGVLLGLSYLTKGGIGLGDVKLIAMTGFFTGLVDIFNILMIATLLSALVSIVLLVFKIKGRKDSLPFAPFILMGTIFILFIN